MASLRDVVAYLCKNYPHKHELSKSRLTKLVYLVDWRCAITYGKQLTDIQWKFNNYGPYVPDVVDAIRQDSSFTITNTLNEHGHVKEIINVNEDVRYSSLKDADKEVIDFVIDHTKTKYWDEFTRLIYSTYPILTQPRYARLNLVKLAEQYKKKRSLFAKK